jgi:hypothetical protein
MSEMFELRSQTHLGSARLRSSGASGAQRLREVGFLLYLYGVRRA